MPYKNIVFVKLEKRLFNDHRFYMMSEKSQLNYIRFILFAAETYNKIPKNLDAIKRAFKTDQDLTEIEATIKEIKLKFPKFKESKHFYYFEGFDEKTNYIPHKETLGKSQGKTWERKEEDKEEDKDKEEEEEEDKKQDGQAEASKVFIKKWNRNYKNLPELMDTCNLIKQYGIEKVENAFHIAAVRDKMSLPYVRGILTDKNKAKKIEMVCVYCKKPTSIVIDKKPVCNYDHLIKYNEQEHK